jgi:hypothetical protein
MTLERSTFYISWGSSSMGILCFAAALINARAGYAVAATLSAMTVVICVWALLFAQRRGWELRALAMESIAMTSANHAEQALNSAIKARKVVEEVRAMIEPLLDKSRAPEEVIHDQP